MWREETQNETRRFFAETFPFRTHFACTPQLCSALLDTVFFVKRERERGEVVGGLSHTPRSKVETFGNPLNMPRPVGLAAF